LLSDMKNHKSIFALIVLMILCITLSAQRHKKEMPAPFFYSSTIVPAPIYYNTLYPANEDTPSAADHVLKLEVEAMNKSCTVYLNGENKGMVSPYVKFDLYLPAGEYTFDAVTLDSPAEHFKDHFQVEDTGMRLSYHVYFPQGGALAADSSEPVRGYNNSAYQIVETMPEFIEGKDSMNRFISAHLKYPDTERENNIQGKVIVEFIVNTDGSLSDVSVARKVSPGLDREAVKVAKMLHFKPGLRHGKPVRVIYLLPIFFRLI
jgi:TonB family protein